VVHCTHTHTHGTVLYCTVPRCTNTKSSTLHTTFTSHLGRMCPPKLASFLLSIYVSGHSTSHELPFSYCLLSPSSHYWPLLPVFILVRVACSCLVILCCLRSSLSVLPAVVTSSCVACDHLPRLDAFVLQIQRDDLMWHCFQTLVHVCVMGAIGIFHQHKLTCAYATSKSFTVYLLVAQITDSSLQTQPHSFFSYR